MRRLSAAWRFGRVHAAVAGVVLGTALVTGGTAAADETPAPPVSLTLTTIPAGWQVRTDLAPTLEVQQDGRAVSSPDAASPDRKADTAPKKVNGHVAPDVLAWAQGEARTLADTDMGMPGNADGSSTALDLLGPAPDQDLHLIVYAPDSADGLSDDQKSNRTRFTALCKKLVDSFVQDR
ncbi:hypothetical protein BJY24_004689 [Nocardia transvalensis]|uniref:Uncharacterized protein n=1 Tax=Nocardia transvalensis TaxID=37333 RepID=A0A7W9PGR5_9NOCA|nr:DUF2613 family protein [Nocardia transvalensis]MBB5915777.1 hypothetical protein [Nocardia transvalensis]